MTAPLGTLTLHPEATRRLRHALLSNGYDDDGLGVPVSLRSLASGAGPAIDWLEIAGNDDPLTALVELFVLGRPVASERARDALSPLALEDALRAGFVEAAGDAVISPWEVMPHDGLLLLGDHPDRMAPSNADFVGTISNSARMLAGHTVRAPVARALDLGTGSGVQALLAARHSDRVLGVDLNPRAGMIARVNGYLGELTNVAYAVGDWFEAVPGEEPFDLVVGNLPFIAAPQVVYRFAHGGLDPNELSRRVVRGAAERLGAGGFAQILTSWTRRASDDALAIVGGFVEGTGCDALLLHHDSRDAAIYAAEQCSWLAPGDRERYAELIRTWLRYYRDAGAEVIDYGLLTLRRSGARAPWLHAIDAPGSPRTTSGEHVVAAFAGNDLVAGLDGDDELLGGRFALADGLRVTQSSRLLSDGYHQDPTVVALEPDVGYGATLSVHATPVVFSLTPAETLNETVARVAAGTGLEQRALGAEAVAAVRELLQLGMVRSRKVSEAV
jgi:hypothetical protein